ncbi:unnamed protein product [Merluccius merluccius]
MERFPAVLSILKQQSTGLIALTTAGGEKLLSAAVFHCPCSSWSFSYGVVFLLAPALVLLVLGYLLNRKTWRLMTGVCLKSSACHWRKLVARGVVFAQVTATASVAPLTWVAVALLKGDYFVCAATGANVTFLRNHLCDVTGDIGDRAQVAQSSCRQRLYLFPCGGPDLGSKTEVDAVLANIRAESQIIGWALIATIFVCNLALTCLARCHSPISFHHLKFWQTYCKQETSLLETFSAEHAKALANRNLKSFFQQQPPEDIATPSKKDWEKLSSFYRFSPDSRFYSTMHQYVELQDMKMSVRSGGPCVDNPAVLSFVDQGGVGLD